MVDSNEPILVLEPLSREDIELFGHYRFLVPIVVEGQRFHVPEGNTVLRALQFLEIRRHVLTMQWNQFCWNDTVGCCELRYRNSKAESPKTGRGCQIMVKPGLEIMKLPKNGVLNDE